MGFLPCRGRHPGKAFLFVTVIWIQLSVAWSQVQMFGHNNSVPGVKVDNLVNTLIIPDKHQVIPEAGKLLNVSFYSRTTPGIFQVVILKDDYSGTIKVTRLTNWREGDVVYKETYPSDTGWSTAVFTKGYVPVENGEFIGLLFINDNPITYNTTSNLNCDGGSPFLTYTMPPGGDLLEGQSVPATKHDVCRNYSYLIPFLSNEKCINVSLAYSYDEDGSGMITGYYIYNLEQTLMGYDSMCWWVVAPPRPDGQEAVVQFWARDVPWGYEVAESGNAGDKPSYCVGSGLRITDETGKFVESICADTPQERKTVYSRSNIMVITFYSDREAKFTGEVVAARKSDARYWDQSPGLAVGIIVAVVVSVVVVLVIIAVVITCCVIKKRKSIQANRNAATVAYQTTGVSAGGYPMQAQPPPAYGKTVPSPTSPMAPPTQGYGQPMAPPIQGYGQPVAPPIQAYGQPMAPPTQAYGQPMAPPTQPYGQPMAPPTQAYPLSTGPIPGPHDQPGQPPLPYPQQTAMPTPPSYDEVMAIKL